MKNFGLADIIFIMFAISLQIMITFPINGSLIRISASDFMIPVIIMMIAGAFIKSGISGNVANSKRIFGWLAVLTLWLSVSLVNGIQFMGGVQTWALINKYVGWFVLILYFVSGINVGNMITIRSKQYFFKAIFASSVLIGVLDLIPYVQSMRGYGEYTRVEGYAENPNAYGVLLVVLVVALLAQQIERPIFSRTIDKIGITLLLALVVISGSRSSWLALFFGLVALYYSSRIEFKKILLMATAAACLVFTLNSAQHIEQAFKKYLIPESQGAPGYPSSDSVVVNVIPYLSRPEGMLVDSGTLHRMKIFRSAIDLWKNHPVMGVGLGGYLWSEMNNSRNYVIHNTALWLLTETGIIGLLLFVAFMIDMFTRLWGKRELERDNTATIVGIAVLAAFVGASIGMESMYQRHIWFFVGWAVANPICSDCAKN